MIFVHLGLVVLHMVCSGLYSLWCCKNTRVPWNALGFGNLQLIVLCKVREEGNACRDLIFWFV